MKDFVNNNSGSEVSKVVFIITTSQFTGAKTAGARRILNIARSLAFNNVVVYIFSYVDFVNLSEELWEMHPRIYVYGKGLEGSPSNKKGLRYFLRVSLNFMSMSKADSVVYLYPTTYILRDFLYLFYFKFLKGYRFYCEINELRSSIAFSSALPAGIYHKIIYILKSAKDAAVYYVNEWQVPLYDGVTVISTALERYFLPRARKLTRIPILCNEDEIEPVDSQQFFDGNVFRICFAGYVKIDKEGFEILLKSLSQINQNYRVELYIYGLMEDADGSRLKDLTVYYGLTGRIIYLGNIDPDQLLNEFNKYHLLILPRTLNKRTRYGLSTKLSEYLVSGTPVLVTDVSDNALIIKDNYNGFIIPPGSPEVMTRKLTEIIESYNSTVHNVVENAHLTVREQLDYRRFSQQYIDFFFSNNV